MRTVQIMISGRVQGVHYRVTAKNEGARLGLKGWVRNRSDGSVEAVATGDESAISAFIDWCHRGPKLALVDRVQVDDYAGEEDWKDFSIRQTL